MMVAGKMRGGIYKRLDYVSVITKRDFSCMRLIIRSSIAITVTSFLCFSEA